MAAVEFASHLLLDRLKVLFPTRGTLDVDQYLIAHKLLDLQPQILFAVVDGRSADVEFPGHCGARFTFADELDNLLVPG